MRAASQVGAGEGVQSKVLRDKLLELEREIEKFRNENTHLAKLRAEREEVCDLFRLQLKWPTLLY